MGETNKLINSNHNESLDTLTDMYNFRCQCNKRGSVRLLKFQASKISSRASWKKRNFKWSLKRLLFFNYLMYYFYQIRAGCFEYCSKVLRIVAIDTRSTGRAPMGISTAPFLLSLSSFCTKGLVDFIFPIGLLPWLNVANLVEKASTLVKVFLLSNQITCKPKFDQYEV